MAGDCFTLLGGARMDVLPLRRDLRAFDPGVLEEVGIKVHGRCGGSGLKSYLCFNSRGGQRTEKVITQAVVIHNEIVIERCLGR